MSRGLQIVLALGCAGLLLIEAPTAWRVFAADVHRIGANAPDPATLAREVPATGPPGRAAGHPRVRTDVPAVLHDAVAAEAPLPADVPEVRAEVRGAAPLARR